jgi:hypothetical protein
MRLPAVQLDDLHGPRPVAIDLKSPSTHDDPIVEARARKSVASQEKEKPRLQWAANTPSRQSFNTDQSRSQASDPAPSWVALNQIRQRQAVIETQEFDLANGDLDFVG